jgi:LysM repeat protein
MDTISREINSMLPVGGIIVGAVALALGLWALTSLSTVKKEITELQQKTARIDDIAAQASAASSKADGVSQQVFGKDGFKDSVQSGFTQVGNAIGTINATLAKMEEATKKPTPAAKGAKGAKAESSGPVVAGPGEYVVKGGDSLAKIARANGVALADLEAVNPGVDSKHLKVGQKLKLPEKK